MWRYYFCEWWGDSAFQAGLDDMGKSGWELVNWHQRTSGHWTIYTAVFKCPA